MKKLPTAQVIITQNEDENRFEIQCQFYVPQTQTIFSRSMCIRTTSQIDDIAIIEEMSLTISRIYQDIHHSVKNYAKHIREDIYETNFPRSGNVIPNV